MNQFRGGFLGGAGSLTVGGPLTMAAGAALIVDAAEGIQFSNSGATTKIHAPNADQIQAVRLGANQLRITHASGPQADVSFTAASNINAQAKFGLVSEAIQVNSDFVASSTDSVIIMNGGAVDRTITGPTTPGADQTLFVINISATNNVVFARNGNEINDATSDYTIPPASTRMFQWKAGSSSWFVAA